MTIAFVVRRGDRTVYEYSRVVGHGTNNEGEYLALIEALNWAIGEGIKGFTVFMDSRLVVNQIKGVYRVRSPKIKPLYEKARELLSAADAKLEYIPREMNVSDRLTRIKTPTV